MNVNLIRSEFRVRELPPVLTPIGEFEKMLAERCGPECGTMFRTQYRIEYNADCIVVFHGGEKVEPPVVEDDGMIYTLLDSFGNLLLNNVMQAIAEGHPALDALVEKVHALHPQGFDMSALRKVVR